MKPSTRFKVAAALFVALAFASLHVALPVASALFSGAETSMPGAAGKYVTAYAVTPERAGEYQRMADDFVGAYLRRWEKSRGARPPASPARLYMFKDRGAFSRHSLSRTGSALENNGGYYSPAEHAVCLVDGDTAGINHELTHMLQHSSWGSALAPWFSEGHAQWHESGAEGSAGRGAERARDELRNWRPLREIVEAKHAEFTAASNDIFYAQAASLFAWLSEPENSPGLDKVIQLQRQGRGGDLEAFCGALGKSADQVEGEWKAWAAKK